MKRTVSTWTIPLSDIPPYFVRLGLNLGVDLIELG